MSLQRCEGGCGEKMPEAPQLAPDSSPALAPEQDSVSLITELINSEMKDMKEMEDKAQGETLYGLVASWDVPMLNQSFI